MVDNFDLCLPFLEFESEDIYYFLQILQRKKENKEVGRNSNVVKNYYITSKEKLLHKKDEIVKLCNFFNARACIRLTPRSYKNTALHHLGQMAQMIKDRNYKSIAKSYLSSSGSTTAGTKKRWIIDIDGEHPDEYVKRLTNFIEACRPDGTKILSKIPSKNGFHLITKPFDLQVFSKVYPEIDVHKDNPTNLFIP